MKRLILTADDFGDSLAVNKAVEEAHRQGVLTAASLMVSGGAAEDAVARARRLPSLRVGLHVVLVDGTPVLPPAAIPGLVDAGGKFPSVLFRAGVRFFFRPKVRRALEREIRAQFEAFGATGLPLDHVNSHHHIHLHPTLAGLILKVGRDFGSPPLRYPREPLLPSWRASRRGLGTRMAAGGFLWPWLLLLRYRMRRSGVRGNDFIFGMNDSGSLTLDHLLLLLEHLPEGISEIYFHPALHGRSGAHAENDPAGEEFAALTSPLLAQALRSSGIPCVGFGDL